MSKPFHRRLLRVRIAYLAMLGLLFSQLVLAGHLRCISGVSAPGEPSSVECHDDRSDSPVSVEDVVCQIHCSSPDIKAESSPTLAVPALPPAIGAYLWPHRRPDTFFAATRPPRYSVPMAWHRPTPHPASLLLI